MTKRKFTINVDAWHYEDHDDVLSAAEVEAQELLGLGGWTLEPRWADENRDEIALTIPAHAIDAALESPLYWVEDEKNLRCECGDWSGERCSAHTVLEHTIVEWMPEHLRAGHVAARNYGTYPHNGAVRLRVTPACADAMIKDDGEWIHRVDRA